MQRAPVNSKRRIFSVQKSNTKNTVTTDKHMNINSFDQNTAQFGINPVTADIRINDNNSFDQKTAQLGVNSEATENKY